jgi:divalent metal cation (Fe/Co/Zn/Cd) transporter
MERGHDLLRARELSAISVALGGSLAGVALIMGFASGSLSMVGFGLDAAIDAAASIVLVWRFTIESRDATRGMHAEQLAERLVGIVLLTSATGLVIGAAHALLVHGQAETGPAQILLLVVSLLALPPLAYAKRRVADRLDSNALRKDAFLTAAGALLAFVALVAGQFGPSIGLWWADSVGSIVIAAALAREGWDILRGREKSPG